MELLIVVLLVQIHSIREHLLNITDLDSHIWRQMRTVDIDATRIDIIETPYPNVPHMVMEGSTCDEMERLVFLNGYQWQFYEIRTSHDVPLELNEIWLSRLDILVDVLAIYSNFFLRFRVDNIPWPQISMLRLGHSIRRLPWPHEVYIAEFIATCNNARHHLLFDAGFEGVRWCTHSHWVKVRLYLSNGTLSDINISEFLSVDIDMRL